MMIDDTMFSAEGMSPNTVKEGLTKHARYQRMLISRVVIKSAHTTARPALLLLSVGKHSIERALLHAEINEVIV
jgi:hypothetical protein